MSQFTERMEQERQLAKSLREAAKAPSNYPAWVLRDLLQMAARAVEGRDSLHWDDPEPWCNHDAPYLQPGDACECGEVVPSTDPERTDER